MKWTLLLVWTLFVCSIEFISLSSGLERHLDIYPHITYFPLTELVVPAEVKDGNLVGKVKIPCKAKGEKPLTYTWKITSSIYNKFHIEIDNGYKELILPVVRSGYMVTCIVSNDHGTVFSDERHIDVIGITHPFKEGPTSSKSKLYFSFGEPLVVPCPAHTVYGPAEYSWGTYRDGAFLPYKDSTHTGITSTGSLVFTYMKSQARQALLYCRVSVGSVQYISKGYGLSAAKSETKYGTVLSLPPKLEERPLKDEIAKMGTVKIMRCIPTGHPEPQILWYKDGDMIQSGVNNMKLESFNRVLVITNISEIHAGNYQCGHGPKFKALATTHLNIEGPPVITSRPPATLTLVTKEEFTLKCRAKQMYSDFPDPLRYYWYKDNNPLHSSSNKVIINGNELKVLNTVTTDSGVYQCMARDTQGYTTTTTRIHIKEIKCPTILPPLFGKFVERSCHVNPSFTTGTRCTVICNRGFVGSGRAKNYRKCLDDGRWSVMQHHCEDITPPTLKEGYGCPSKIITPTDKNGSPNGVQVTWKPPEAEDNSDLVTIIEPKEIVGNSHWFPVGRKVVRYTFVDVGKLNVSCQFPVNVFTRTEIISKPPSLTYVLKGHSIVLPCIARSYPIKPYYSWTKKSFQDNDKPKPLTSNAHVQLLKGGEELRIDKVGYEDSGKYACEAVNIYYDMPGVRDVAYGSVEVVAAVEWSSWQPWSKCSVKSCGQGIRSRKRTCYKKGTQRQAIGCKGLENNNEICHVKCTTTTTTTTTPSPTTTTTQPVTQDALLERGLTVTDSSRRGAVHMIFAQYENQAREWVKHRSPWLHEWLDSTEGRVGFALLLGVLCFVVVLIAWCCGRICGKKKASSEDEEKPSDGKTVEKEKDAKPSSKNTSAAEGHKEPIYENTTGIDHRYFDDTGYLRDYNEPIYENTTGIGHHHLENSGFEQGHNEPIYVNTAYYQENAPSNYEQ